MNEGVIVISGLVLGIWVYLVLLHGRYWLERPRKAPAAGPKHWPEVVAIVPARNETPVVGEAVRSLLQQDYAGKLRIFAGQPGINVIWKDNGRVVSGEIQKATRPEVRSFHPGRIRTPT